MAVMHFNKRGGGSRALLGLALGLSLMQGVGAQVAEATSRSAASPAAALASGELNIELGAVPSAASAGGSMAQSPVPPEIAPPESASAHKSAEPRSVRPRALPSGLPPGLGFDKPGQGLTVQDNAHVERLVFQNTPLRVVLPLNRERVVSFSEPVVLHTPEGFATWVRAQLLEQTAYLRALSPAGTVRIVAEGLQSGRHIPIDVVVDASSRVAASPLEIRIAGSRAMPQPADDASPMEVEKPSGEALDMVGLTRFAAQSLYAPRRLMPAIPGVRSLPVSNQPVEGLYRGWRVRAEPMGAWRSGALTVTAVRLSNLAAQAMDVDVRELRGQWLAATTQHLRLLPAGSDWDSTTVYLVCDRPFEACR